MLEDTSTAYLLCSGWGKEVVVQDFIVHAPIHLLLNAVKLPCTLSRKINPMHNVSISMPDCDDGVLWVILTSLPTNMAGWLDAKELDFVSFDHSSFSQDFSCGWKISIHYSVVCWQWCSDCGPDLLPIINNLLACSFWLIHNLYHDHPHPLRQDLAWSSRSMLILYFFHFWIVTSTVVIYSPSFLLMVMWLISA